MGDEQTLLLLSRYLSLDVYLVVDDVVDVAERFGFRYPEFVASPCIRQSSFWISGIPVGSIALFSVSCRCHMAVLLVS